MPSLGSRGLAVAAAVAPRTAPGRARPAAAAAAVVVVVVSAEAPAPPDPRCLCRQVTVADGEAPEEVGARGGAGGRPGGARRRPARSLARSLTHAVSLSLPCLQPKRRSARLSAVSRGAGGRLGVVVRVFPDRKGDYRGLNLSVACSFLSETCSCQSGAETQEVSGKGESLREEEGGRVRCARAWCPPVPCRRCVVCERSRSSSRVPCGNAHRAAVWCSGAPAGTCRCFPPLFE